MIKPQSLHSHHSKLQLHRCVFRSLPPVPRSQPQNYQICLLVSSSLPMSDRKTGWGLPGNSASYQLGSCPHRTYALFFIVEETLHFTVIVFPPAKRKHTAQFTVFFLLQLNNKDLTISSRGQSGAVTTARSVCGVTGMPLNGHYNRSMSILVLS